MKDPFSPVSDRAASTPDGVRVYAIGDIHGCANLLSLMIEKMLLDDAKAASEREARFVFLGDYIDRGPASKGVVDLLLSFSELMPDTLFLMGNHEVLLTRFLENSDYLNGWASNGGIETLSSYGVLDDNVNRQRLNAAALRVETLRKMPMAHQEFFAGLRTSAVIGDYFFAHAGVRPGVALDRQNEDDLLWIRSQFLNYEGDFGKIVVHGHTPFDQPQSLPNRIGIDTGAFFTGRLTAVILEGSTRRFIQT